MIQDLDILSFSEMQAESSDRYEKADLAATSIVEDGAGRFVVQRGPSDNSHIVRLVETAGHPVGKCSCEGYSGGADHPGHPGPCSHRAAVWRAEHHDLVSIPRARLRSADVEVPCEDRKLSQAVDRARADGGERR